LELVKFYNATCNDGCSLGWNLNNLVSGWEGITITDGRVTGINASYEELSGTLPDLNLPELLVLDLRYNDLSGSIPPLTNLVKLEEINLGGNQLSGCFSAALVHLCNTSYYFGNNADLPGNGNFIEFCNNGFGSCGAVNPSDSLELVNFYNVTCNDSCTLIRIYLYSLICQISTASI